MPDESFSAPAGDEIRGENAYFRGPMYRGPGYYGPRGPMFGWPYRRWRRRGCCAPMGCGCLTLALFPLALVGATIHGALSGGSILHAMTNSAAAISSTFHAAIPLMSTLLAHVPQF